MKTIWCCIVLTAAVCSSDSLSQATEPNETFGASTILAPGTLSVSDELAPGFAVFPDTLLGVRDLFGDIFDFDDNSSTLGDEFASGLSNVPINSNGTIDFSISGVGDDSFIGNHNESGDYEAFVEVFDVFGDPFDQFSVTGTLEPGLADDHFSFTSALGGTYTVNIDNTLGGENGGDVDFFTFTGLTPGETFSAETLDPTLSEVDTLMGWFDDSGTLLVSDDDGGTGFLSMITGSVPSSGQLTFAVSGLDDDFFDGSHIEAGDYDLQLTILTADFDNDEDVDAGDLAQWQGDFGQNGNSDSDSDNDSDGVDFLAWQRQHGLGVPSALSSSTNTVPEPSAILLLTAVAIFVAMGRVKPRGCNPWTFDSRAFH